MVVVDLHLQLNNQSKSAEGKLCPTMIKTTTMVPSVLKGVKRASYLLGFMPSLPLNLIITIRLFQIILNPLQGSRLNLLTTRGWGINTPASGCQLIKVLSLIYIATSTLVFLLTVTTLVREE